MILPITLTAAGAAALINFWLGIRCGMVRTREKISIGDGGNEALIRRMRAQANFIESAPFVLILIGLIELAGGTTTWLWVVSGVYLLGRLAHGLGMDGGSLGAGRTVGTITSMLALLGLAIYAIAIPYRAEGIVTPVSVSDTAIENVAAE